MRHSTKRSAPSRFQRAALLWAASLPPLFTSVLTTSRVEAQIDVTRLAEQQPELLGQLRAMPHSSLLARGSRLTWSAPRRLLMDRARHWIGLEDLRERWQAEGTPSLSGQGVVVGVVDGGIDFTHPDFTDATGATRIEWLIDFGLPPLGIHAELEREYGCDGEDHRCGILSSTELDALSAGERVAASDGSEVVPVADRLGHGTHVTSLAAGSGQSSARYAGVAPEATLIVASASDELAVSDAVVLLAARFIFDRASELAMPAVVNMSLGGNFGPHDGSSAIEAALAELVGPPGRAVVVAGGNSGVLYQGELAGYDGPFGIHTEVHLSHDGSARVPILIPSKGAGDGAFLVWIEGPANDRFRVGVESSSGDTLVPPIAPGVAVGARDGERDILLINHVLAPDIEGGEDFGEGAVLVVSGDFSDVDVYALRLEGEGNAHLWIESIGSIGSESGAQGAIFPGATRAGTITLPATSPHVIAVGATVNRDAWPSSEEGTIELADFGLARFRTPDTPAFFSSQGPNLTGLMKPDILAPGFAVIGAMGSAAAPVVNGLPNVLSMFALSPVCSVSSTCSVVDDEHGVALGTSMSAPIVAGAVALLLQRNPNATQTELLQLLQAGSRKLDDTSERAAPGTLDIAASLRALDIAEGASAPDPDAGSFLSLGAAFAYPDPVLELSAHLHLRAGKELADASASELEIALTNGTLRTPPKRIAPGLVSFRFSANHGSADKKLKFRVSHKGALLTERELRIEMDANVAQRGSSVRGGCSFTPRSTAAQGASYTLLLLGLFAWRGRAQRRRFACAG